jgi:hypothetical protein
MKAKKIGVIASAMAIGMAGMLGTAQVSQSTVVNQQQQTRNLPTQEIKSTAPRKSVSRKSIIAQAGGLDVVLEGGVFGLTPKQYGMRFGNGKSRLGKVNKLRLSHNAKLKRRKSK